MKLITSIRIVTVLILFVFGSVGTLIYASEIGNIFRDGVNRNNIQGFTIGAILSLFLIIGQNYYSISISKVLSSFGQITITTHLIKYQRGDKIKKDIIANISSEVARLQGLVGNNFGVLLSYFICALVFVFKIILDKQFNVLFVILILIPLLILFQKFSNSILTKTGKENRESSEKVSIASVSLVTNKESHIASGYAKNSIKNYRSYLFGWLNSIRTLWLVNSLGKYFIETFAMIIGIILIAKSIDNLEYLIVIARLLPGISAFNNFRNGFKYNRDIIYDFYRFIKKSDHETNKDNGYFLKLFCNEYLKTNFDVNISPSGFYLMVGKSGCGKSTYIKSLCSYLFSIDKDYFYLDSNFNDQFLIQSHLDGVNLEKIYQHSLVSDISPELGYDELSTGQKQRFLILCALDKINSFEYLIIDEALNGLDANNRNIIMNMLEKVSNEKTIILIDHEFSNNENRPKCLKLIKIIT